MKCPVCNSIRVTISKEGISCKRCGWVNKKIKQRILN